MLDFRRYFFETLAPSGLTRPGTPPQEGLAGPHPEAAEVRATLFGERSFPASAMRRCAGPRNCWGCSETCWVQTCTAAN
ncbi:hypothetical protein GCM10008949_25130 [Deinococcus humi]|nr:hypothetical protein GCM10008949_25130 [Deinococcus humi]